MTRLNVYLAEEQVGVLDRDSGGELRFTYLPGARPISLSLPFRQEPFEEGECYPFFEGVLPEDQQRRAIERATHVSSSNVLDLLHLLGGEIAGAVRLLREGEDPVAPPQGEPPSPLPDSTLGQLLETLPLRPMLAGEGELRLSLAGAQTKLPVCLTDGRVRLPAPGEPTTHIIKPAIPSYPATTENEAFVMRLAAEVGLPVAHVEARQLGAEKGPRSYLLVARYDREVRDGRVVRLHQEDFCQALGRSSAYKYETNLGPGVGRCRQVLFDHSVKPAADARTFLDAILFNLLVGNGDAHAKNFSLLYTADGIRLAPFYDLLSTLYYPSLSPLMAMAIGGKFRFSEVDRQVLEEGAKAIGLTRTYLTKRLDLLRDKLPGAAAKVAEDLSGKGLDDEVLERLEQLVRDRVGRFTHGLK